MSQFLERNKKKGSLAALLLFFKRGKGAGPLMVLVLLLSFVFMAPASLLSGLPFFDKLARKFGLRSDLGGGQLPSDRLNEIIREARERQGVLDGPGALFGKGRNEYFGKSTVGLVKGGDLPTEGSKYVGDAESVGGVLRPEDSQKIKDGVSVSEDEMAGGLTNPAFAEGVQPGQFKAEFENLKGYAGLAGSNPGMAGARPLDASRDLVARQLATGEAPGTGRGSSIRGTNAGKLSDRRFRALSARVQGAVGDSRGGKREVLHQLAQTRAYSVSAAPPPGHCDPGSCAGETASQVAGRPFDGSQVQNNIVSAGELGEPGGTQVPDMSGPLGEADKMAQDAEKCVKANETYGPRMDASSAIIQDKSNQINSSCSGGGCSSNASLCRRLSNEIKAECQNYNGIVAEWSAACPLSNGRYDTHGGC